MTLSTVCKIQQQKNSVDLARNLFCKFEKQRCHKGGVHIHIVESVTGTAIKQIHLNYSKEVLTSLHPYWIPFIDGE